MSLKRAILFLNLLLITTTIFITGLMAKEPQKNLTGKIIVSSKEVMRDERFSVSLEGFEADQIVRVKVEEVDDIGVVWESYADYKVDSTGKVNLDQQPPIAGSFDEADSMALLMSMVAKNPKNEPEFCKKTFDPIITKITVRVGNQIVDEVRVMRKIMADNIIMEFIEENGIVGIIFRPKENKPNPGIIVLGGWDGGYEAHRAAVLASHGYTTFALAYHKLNGLPDELVEIPLEYFEKAIELFKNHPSVIQERIGITGVSMGGHLSLLLSSRYPDIRAVAAINPSGLVWQSTKVKGIGFIPTSCWSYQGNPLPYVPFDAPKSFILSFGWHQLIKKPFSPMSMFVNGLKKASPETIEKATIQVEKINGPVLITSAEIGTVWPERTFCNMIEQRMKDKAFPHPFEHLYIQDVGHLVADPFTPVNCIRKNWEIVETAGSPKSNRIGSVKRWLAVINFFEKYLKDNI